MKKILGFIVLSLLWSNNGFAELLSFKKYGKCKNISNIYIINPKSLKYIAFDKKNFYLNYQSSTKKFGKTIRILRTIENRIETDSFDIENTKYDIIFNKSEGHLIIKNYRLNVISNYDCEKISKLKLLKSKF